MDLLAPTNDALERVKMRTIYKTGNGLDSLFTAFIFVYCGMEGGTTDWNSRTEQSEIRRETA